MQHLESSALRRELREYFRLAWPIVVAQLSFVSMGTVDTIMAGRLGKEAPLGVRINKAVDLQARRAGKPPVAMGPQRSGVTRSRGLPCLTMASRYSSQSGCSPEIERK